MASHDLGQHVGQRTANEKTHWAPALHHNIASPGADRIGVGALIDPDLCHHLAATTRTTALVAQRRY